MTSLETVLGDFELWIKYKLKEGGIDEKVRKVQYQVYTHQIHSIFYG